MTREECFICGGEYSKILTGKDYMHHSSDKIYTIVKCQNCGVEMIHPKPSKQEIMTWYPSDYYSYRIVTNKQTFKNKFISLIRSILVGNTFNIPREKGQGKYFLDVGCGIGTNLQTMEKRGWNAYGFEIGEKNKKGNIFYGSNISEVDFGPLKFDTIYLSHVMEHMEDPEGSFQKIYNLLKKGGKVIIKTPNIDCISARHWGPYAVERDIPRHVIIYTKKSAIFLFKKYGFIIQKSRYLSQGTIYPAYLRRNKDQGKRSWSIMIVYFIFYRIYATIIGSTNQMGFILTK